MKKKKWKHKKLFIILAVVAVLVILMFSCASRGAKAAFVKETVERRDIRTYHSFSGTVTPLTEQNVYAEVVNTRVDSLAVAEGDVVKEGDPLVYLDSRSIEEQIEQLETSMSVNSAGTEISISMAKSNYENYKKGIEQGTNSQLLSAQQAVTAAQNQLATAQRNYDRAVSENADGSAQAVASADTQVSSAYEQVRLAQINLETADHAKRNAVGEEMEFQANQQYETAEHSLQSAMVAYELAVFNAEAAKRNDDAAVASYQDQLIAAQTSHLNAVNNLAAVQKSVTETLATYKTQYEQALASSDTSVNDLQLSRLYQQLEDCAIKAPMSGTVTVINVKEGDMVMAGSAVAVVTDFGKMKVDIRINEYDIEGVNTGDEVEITVNALGMDYVGKITKISRVATVASGVSYFGAEVEFEADEAVRGGMSVEVRLVTADARGVLSIASRSIDTREDGSAFVLVQDAKGTVQERDVSCGVTDGTYIEITSGLQENETVLYMPQTLDEIRNNMMGD